MSENTVTASIAGALAAIVAAFVWLVKRPKNGNGESKESPADAIARNIALIERENIDLPANWRRFTDDRIEHKIGNFAHLLYLWVRMLDRGLAAEVKLQILEEAERLVKRRDETR